MKYSVKNENGQQVLVPLRDGEGPDCLPISENRLPAVVPASMPEHHGDHMLVPGQVIEIVHDVTKLGLSLAQAVQSSVQHNVRCYYQEIIEITEET